MADGQQLVQLKEIKAVVYQCVPGWLKFQDFFRARGESSRQWYDWRVAVQARSGLIYIDGGARFQEEADALAERVAQFLGVQRLFEDKVHQS
jgi:hypothetical protein